MANAIIDEITDELNETVKRAFHRLTAEARSASHLASDLVNEGGARARKGVDVARQEVRDHPARSVAFGVAVGALATLLLTWRGGRHKH
jgi:ElaB/YqjD/DUF883 family membrane-anchored ribosome-binding protein